MIMLTTTFEILFLIILNFGNIFSRITTREATEINLCPFEYPNAYFNGTNCCKSQKNCQQKSLEFHNTCCNSADYVFCPFESGCDDCEFSRFRNKRFMLLEMFKWNAWNFAIFLEFEYTHISLRNNIVLHRAVLL